MATMIRQTLRLDRTSTNLFDKDSFKIIGPNEAIILPRAWEHMVRAGWHVRLKLLYDRKVEHQCVEMPQTCQQVDGTASLGTKYNTAKVFEEATKELQAIREAHSLEIAQQEAAQEARQKEREEQEELHRSWRCVISASIPDLRMKIMGLITNDNIKSHYGILLCLAILCADSHNQTLPCHRHVRHSLFG